MRYIKKFGIVESIIVPDLIDNDVLINSFSDLIQYGKNNRFDVVHYDEFYGSLSDVDKKTAPPDVIPFFALFHPERNKPMFVLGKTFNGRWIGHSNPSFKSVVDDIIKHEMIHGKQISKRNQNVRYNLPDPLDRKEYFSDKMEVMAFSWSIANELSKYFSSVKKCIHGMKSDRTWQEISKRCDKKTLDRYRKYIYLYLEDIFSK